MEMVLPHNNDVTSIADRHFRVKCPHCVTHSGISAISIPRYDLLLRYEPKNVGIAYQCDVCRETVFLRFPVRYDFGNHRVWISDNYSEAERPMEDYEFAHLPDAVASDFKEALMCYSHSCFNAFAAMCRRAIQSASTQMGAEGKDKVQKQVQDLKSMSDIDAETFEVLKAIVLAGHDGSHPHLPPLSAERADVLLELMKDVLYQLFVRRAKIKEAEEKRKQAIAAKRAGA